jgi:hypothetical protein
MLDDVFNLDSQELGDDAEMKKNFKKLISTYNFTDEIPKEYLFVRLKKEFRSD